MEQKRALSGLDRRRSFEVAPMPDGPRPGCGRMEDDSRQHRGQWMRLEFE